ncbi:MAG TPA: hypothetical protein VFN71_09955 [Methylomirabilota bacterium]|nr:hypothetical protein [Methylomirabilota bacterium]
MADAADLAAFANFRIALNSFSAIVIASDHGGMLSAVELAFLNGHSADIIDYLNAGGGLYAEAESNATGMIGNTPRFAFLPFIVGSTDFQASEVSNTVTPFGASLGRTDFDVNGNFSHNFFAATGGTNPVDLFNGDSSKPLTLAFRGPITPRGVRAPATLLLVAPGLGILAGLAWRRRSA